MFDGSRLRELRKKKGLTQDELGNRINVTKTSISCYEKGIRIPNMETFLKLIKELETTPNYLFGIDAFEVIKTSDTNYILSCTKEDYEILKILKNEDKVYNMFKKNPIRVIDFLINYYK